MIIKIEKLDHQGRGIGFLNGKIVFVPFSLPNDLVDIKITKEKSKFAEGIVTKYIEKSDMHDTNTCPYFTICGGCDLRHLSYENELIFKENKVKEILNKFTSKSVKVEKIVRCDDINNYRNKVKFSVSEKLGYLKRNTHDIINIDNCLLANLKIKKIVKVINTCDLKGVESITIRASKNVDDAMVIIDASNDVNTLVNKLDKFTSNIIVNKKIIKGKGYILEDLNGIKYKISPNAFFQVNTNMAIKLYNLVLEKCQLNGKETVYDLFCGTGSIALYLSKKAKKVIGVEINKEAVLDAKENSKINNINNVSFYSEDVTKFVDRNLEKADIVVFDPPRSGLNNKIIESIIKLNPKKIVYVSCDPATLARDLKDFSSNYDIESVTPVDMFPRTYHVESVALLIKKHQI